MEDYTKWNDKDLQYLFGVMPKVISLSIPMSNEEFDKVRGEIQRRKLILPEEKIERLLFTYEKIGKTDLIHKCWRFASADEVKIIVASMIENGDASLIKESGIEYYTYKTYNKTIGGTGEGILSSPQA